jgi:hypothetical protein
MTSRNARVRATLSALIPKNESLECTGCFKKSFTLTNSMELNTNQEIPSC